MKLVLHGNKVYIRRMFKHLRKEHPSTRSRMKIIKLKGGKK
jgi:hypothetical protein